MKKPYWYFIIVFMLVVAGTALYAGTRTDIYKSEVLIGMDDTSSVYAGMQAISELSSNRIFLERLIESNQMFGYGRQKDFVMEQAVNSAQRQIRISRKYEGAIAIAFLSPDPQSAQAVTRALTRELLQSREESEAKPFYHVISEASLPTHAEYPNRIQIMLVGIILGLMFGAVASFIFTKRLLAGAPKTS